MSTSIDDIKTTEEMELQTMTKNEPNSNSNYKISDQIENCHSTRDASKVGSLNGPEEDDTLLKGKGFYA